MGSLTPLSKRLIGFAVVSAIALAAWHLVLNQKSQVTSPNMSSTAVAAPKVVLSGAEYFDTGRKFLGNGDFAQARVQLQAALNAGDGSAACLLGEMTLKGQGGIAVNQDAAAKLFQLAQSRGKICFAPD